ncbi:MAG: hypothetical protein Q9192_004215 [Flavoplaca navasiana]
MNVVRLVRGEQECHLYHASLVCDRQVEMEILKDFDLCQLVTGVLAFRYVPVACSPLKARSRPIPQQFAAEARKFRDLATVALNDKNDLSWEDAYHLLLLCTRIEEDQAAATTTTNVTPTTRLTPLTDPPSSAIIPLATTSWGKSSDVVKCPGSGKTSFLAFLEPEDPDRTRTTHSQSITMMPQYRNWSFEELRLADYEQGRGRPNRVIEGPMTLSMTVNTLQNMSCRLSSAEQENVRLQGELTMLRTSAATKVDLSQVQMELASLRCDLLSNNNHDSKKRKTLSPALSMPSQIPSANPSAFGFPIAPPEHTTTTATTPSTSSFFKFPPASSSAFGGFQDAAASSTSSLFGPAPNDFPPSQGFGPFQHTPTSNTTSTASCLFGAAPNPFAITPASITPAVFNFNQKTPSTLVAQSPPPVNQFAQPQETLPTSLVSSSPKAAPASIAPHSTNSTSSNAFPAFGAFAYGGLTPQASQSASQANSLTKTDSTS